MLQMAHVASRSRSAVDRVTANAWVAGLLALGAFGVIGTAGAQASCAQMPSLQEAVATAPLVFVGTVVSTSDGDRVARVSVESIWKGPDLPAYVDVHGSPSSGSGTATSVDRRFRAGERDLFVLFSDRPPYQDNSAAPLNGTPRNWGRSLQMTPDRRLRRLPEKSFSIW